MRTNVHVRPTEDTAKQPRWIAAARKDVSTGRSGNLRQSPPKRRLTDDHALMRNGEACRLLEFLKRDGRSRGDLDRAATVPALDREVWQATTLYITGVALP